MFLSPTWIDPDEMFRDIHRDCKAGRVDEELILNFCSSMAKLFPDEHKYQYLSCYIESPHIACEYCTKVRDLPFVRLKMNKDPRWWRVYDYYRRHRSTPE
jgi:hypothetical protein